jgi:hypothetical protein
MCCIAPGPVISAIVNVFLGSICTDGLTFQPCPKSLDAFKPVPVVAIPPRPFSPLKFSGLIDLVLASDKRNRFPIFTSTPLKLPALWLTAGRTNDKEIKQTKIFFIYITISFKSI